MYPFTNLSPLWMDLSQWFLFVWVCVCACECTSLFFFYSLKCWNVVKENCIYRADGVHLTPLSKSTDRFVSVCGSLCVMCNMQVKIASINNRTRFFLRLFNKLCWFFFLSFHFFSVLVHLVNATSNVQLWDYFEQVSQNAFELIPYTMCDEVTIEKWAVERLEGKKKVWTLKIYSNDLHRKSIQRIIVYVQHWKEEEKQLLKFVILTIAFITFILRTTTTTTKILFLSPQY